MNQLKVNQQHTIVSLFAQGWSKRRIARELALDRATVRKYLAAGAAKPPAPQTGSESAAGSKSPTHPHTGSLASRGPVSLCDPWREPIAVALAAGLSVQRIYQDLVAEHQFAGSYHAVRRFVLRHHGGTELPFRRLECGPGQELQVDFGQGAWVVEDGKRRKTHLFRGVLSHSRKQGGALTQGAARAARVGAGRACSSVVWRTASGTSGACPRRWCSTT